MIRPYLYAAIGLAIILLCAGLYHTGYSNGVNAQRVEDAQATAAATAQVAAEQSEKTRLADAAASSYAAQRDKALSDYQSLAAKYRAHSAAKPATVCKLDADATAIWNAATRGEPTK